MEQSWFLLSGGDVFGLRWLPLLFFLPPKHQDITQQKTYHRNRSKVKHKTSHFLACPGLPCHGLCNLLCTWPALTWESSAAPPEPPVSWVFREWLFKWRTIYFSLYSCLSSQTPPREHPFDSKNNNKYGPWFFLPLPLSLPPFLLLALPPTSFPSLFPFKWRRTSLQRIILNIFQGFNSNGN